MPGMQERIATSRNGFSEEDGSLPRATHFGSSEMLGTGAGSGEMDARMVFVACWVSWILCPINVSYYIVSGHKPQIGDMVCWVTGFSVLLFKFCLQIFVLGLPIEMLKISREFSQK